MNKLKNLIELFLNNLFPKKCTICSKPSNKLVCDSCYPQTFKKATRKYSKNTQILFEYTDNLKKIIGEFKYNKNKNILSIIETEIFKNTKNIYQDIDYIIPIPLNPLREKERGFNQAELMIEKYALFNKIPLKTNIVTRKYNTTKSHKLDKQARLDQASKAFEIWKNMKHEIDNKNILLFDDILTTGTTIEHVSKLLTQNGANKVMILAFCTAI